MTKVPVMGDHIEFCSGCREEADRKSDEIKKKQEDVKRSRRISENLQQCSIGQRFMGMSFDDYKPSNPKAASVLKECREYVEGFGDRSGSNILMIGAPGTGKNMLAAIIGQEIIKRDFYFLHTTAMKLVRKIKDSWRNKEESEQSIIDSFVSPSLLAIDEVGVQFGTPTEQLYLTEVINERYEKRRPTILISNLKLSQITEIMGERVIDRFYDDGSKFLVFDWDSYRRRPKTEGVAA